MYQARRLFKDRLVGKESYDRFDGILTSSLRNDWNLHSDTEKPLYFVTWGSTIVPSDQTELMRSFGRPLGPIAVEDFREIVQKGLISFGRAIFVYVFVNKLVSYIFVYFPIVMQSNTSAIVMLI